MWYPYHSTSILGEGGDTLLLSKTVQATGNVIGKCNLLMCVRIPSTYQHVTIAQIILFEKHNLYLECRL